MVHQNSNSVPSYRLEYRHGSSKPVVFDVDSEEFLIGSIPGCDLRLPGTGLPEQICILRATSQGLVLRKLAPHFLIKINEKPVNAPQGLLINENDELQIGGSFLKLLPANEAGMPAHWASDDDQEDISQQREQLFSEILHQKKLLQHQEKQLLEATEELEQDRLLWYRRREEIEKEIKAAQQKIELAKQLPEPVPPLDVAQIRTEIRKELDQEYRSHQERLERMQLAIRESAVDLRERKQAFEESQRKIDPRLKQLAQKEEELQQREAAFQQLQTAFELEKQTLAEKYRAKDAELHRQQREVGEQETKARQLAEQAARESQQYQADLVRIDRQRAALEQQEATHTNEVVAFQERCVQLQESVLEFQEQLQLFDQREQAAIQKEQELAQWQNKLELEHKEIVQQRAQLEAQQLSLSTVRAQLEEARERLEADEQKLVQERLQLTTIAQQSQAELRQAELLREQMAGERDEHAESYRIYQERSALMQQATERLRVAEENLAEQEQMLSQLQQELQENAREQELEAQSLRMRAQSLLETQRHLEQESTTWTARATQVEEEQQANTQLQEQLRTRGEELAQKQSILELRAKELDEHTRSLAERAATLEQLQAQLADTRQLSEAELAEIAQRDEQLKNAELTIAQQREELEAAKQEFQAEHQKAQQELAVNRQQIAELQQMLSEQSAQLLDQMPDLENRAKTALDLTSQAREALRAQLAELHQYAQRSNEELNLVSSQIQTDYARLRQQEQVLNKSRSEHRLAVSTFRQQLIEWQARFTELRNHLQSGNEKVDRKKKQVDAATEQLQAQTAIIRQQEQEIDLKRSEVDRHLHDMREWFRSKFREIADSQWSRHRASNRAIPMAEEVPASTPGEPVIIPIHAELEENDQALGERLRSLELIDRETLETLWQETQRSRKNLRQILLQGGYLTLYQLALIESNNLSGLILGRFRVIDRLTSNTRESIYRVYDPQVEDRPGSQTTRLLRHLSDVEMVDALHPDEFVQRFVALRDLAHPNLVGTLEILDIQDRPAVLQEWVRGFLSSDCPPVVAMPGVWYRLILQLARGLHAAHEHSLYHGNLSHTDIIFAANGVVRIQGVGEPAWLHPVSGKEDPTALDDLKAMGQVAAYWATANQRKKGTKGTDLIAPVQQFIGRFPGDHGIIVPTEDRFQDLSDVLQALAEMAEQMPKDQANWDKFLKFLDGSASDEPMLKLSA
ncbi:MAG: hypothetical protein R3B84_15415 [Zavarzinella sp.]